MPLPGDIDLSTPASTEAAIGLPVEVIYPLLDDIVTIITHCENSKSWIRYNAHNTRYSAIHLLDAMAPYLYHEHSVDDGVVASPAIAQLMHGIMRCRKINFALYCAVADKIVEIAKSRRPRKRDPESTDGRIY